MKKPTALTHQELNQKLDPAELGFKNTSEIKPTKHFIDQERALEALHFGISIKKLGYNLFAMGPLGIGKRALVTSVLEAYAKTQPTPPDWCYIYNFSSPGKPIALKLPPGLGIEFQHDMDKLISEVGTSILSVFESEEYNRRMKMIHNYFNVKRKKSANAKAEKIPAYYKEQHEKEKKLQIKLTSTLTQPLFTRLMRKYKKFPEVIEYISEVKKDLLNHIVEFIKKDENTDLFTLNLENPILTKYKINLLVDNSQVKHAPIIYEQTPTYSSLICRVEHTSQYGTLVTNFSFIRAGSLHKANGGFLIIEARKLNEKHEAWEALKSALYAGNIKIEPLKHVGNDIITPVSLDPMPIPLDIKIILLGDRNTYYDLCEEDIDFTDLFKVPVDFNDEISRNQDNIKAYAKLIATIIRKDNLHPFKADAVARVIDFSSRMAEDNQKLSALFRNIEALVIESDYWATQENKKLVTAIHVTRAIYTSYYRMDRARDLYYEDIARNFLIINTAEKTIGQINCLSVRRVGNFAYGHPTRVTARIRKGRGKLIDIQREIKLAGPLHSKAGLVIANYLASHFDEDQCFSLHASLSFEQIYVWTEGDSASAGELCALLSAIAEIPILQNFAITGSTDQYGNVQSVGGINEKIEGFFDICQARGLDGTHGVLIPAVNRQNLVLKEEVIAAVKSKKFRIYLIETVDDAISLLTNESLETIYGKVRSRLKKFARMRRCCVNHILHKRNNDDS